MNRKILAAVSAAVLILQGGCSILKTEYYSVKDYTEDMTSEVEELTGSIGNYDSLLRAISGMVQRHEESGRLTFSNYDGTVSDDIAVACWEVKSDTALGAYAVDYMSYDINRIVSYYEAEIFINYRRTREQVDSIQALSTMTQFEDAIYDAISDLEPVLTVSMNTTGLSEEDIQALVSGVYFENPLMTVIEPQVTAEIYPESGIERIIEVYIDYGGDTDTLREMKSQLREGVVELSVSVTGRASPETALALADALARHCTLLDETTVESSVDSTAYGAVVNGAADSEGLAMAFMSLCIAKDIECVVVEGRLNTRAHFWNIVTIDGVSRHVDVSGILAGESVMLRTDAEIIDRYWWDTGLYPVCGDEQESVQDSRSVLENTV